MDGIPPIEVENAKKYYLEGWFTMYTLILRTFIISFIAVGLGLSVNFISPQGIEIMGPIPIKTIEGIDIIEKDAVWASFQAKMSIFIDARSTEEFSEGHIPGATLLTQDNFEDNVSVLLDLIPLDSEIITYCSGSGCESSLEVAALLKEEGYTNISVFYGGWSLWKKAGYPIEKFNPIEETL